MSYYKLNLRNDSIVDDDSFEDLRNPGSKVAGAVFGVPLGAAVGSVANSVYGAGQGLVYGAQDGYNMVSRNVRDLTGSDVAGSIAGGLLGAPVGAAIGSAGYAVKDAGYGLVNGSKTAYNLVGELFEGKKGKKAKKGGKKAKKSGKKGKKRGKTTIERVSHNASSLGDDDIFGEQQAPHFEKVNVD